MRLIDADALKQYMMEGLEQTRKLFKDNGEFAEIVTKELCRDIDEQPTINQWIPITTRPMDEEERLEWSEKLGYDIEYEDAVMFDCPMPEDGQEILVSYKHWISTDTCKIDGDFYGLEENDDWDGVVAWMPLPDPYKEE